MIRMDPVEEKHHVVMVRLSNLRADSWFSIVKI